MDPKKLIIIGAGPGGYVAAIRASQLGAKVTLIEADKVGGTCLNCGCIPTKALLADARMLHKLRHSPVFQTLLKSDFDPLQRMMDRKANVVQEMVRGVEMLLSSQHVNVKYGRAGLLGGCHVSFIGRETPEEILEADAIFLAPGSIPKTIPGLGPDGERIITSDEALDLRNPPKDLVIIGGGYIGVELATIFNLLGTQVTILEALENILPGLEDELVRNLRRHLEGNGIKIWTKALIEESSAEGEGVKLVFKATQGIQEVRAGKVLLAVGRGPRLDLDFAKAGVEVSENGIRVNDRLETTAPRIYAMGDATGGILLAHVASEQGEIAAENVMGLDRKMESHPVPLCIFTVPEVASIGLTEREARSRGGIKIGRFPFRSNPTALVSGETEGLVKVIASREKDQILGIHIIGPQASVLVSMGGLIMRQGGTAKEFARLMQAHPTLPEAMKEAVLDLDGGAIHLPRPLRMPDKRQGHGA